MGYVRNAKCGLWAWGVLSLDQNILHAPNIKKNGGKTMLEIIIVLLCLAASAAVYPIFVKKFGDME